MKYLLVALFLIFAICQLSFGASGDKTPLSVLKFHTISTSTRRTCTRGEMRVDKSNLYVCYSTTPGGWKKVSLGTTY